jgi:hypothetical protein
MKCWTIPVVLVLLFLLVHLVNGCTIVMVSKGPLILVGNNEDWKNPKTKMWFIPAGMANMGGCALVLATCMPRAEVL